MFNRDQLNMVPAHATLQTAYASLNGAQSAPTPQQVMGVAVLFHQLCVALSLDPSEMLDKARRVERHAQDHYSLELRALQQYIREEIRQ